MHIRKKYNVQGLASHDFARTLATVLDCANGYQKERQEEVDAEESFPRESRGDEEANAEENENF